MRADHLSESRAKTTERKRWQGVGDVDLKPRKMIITFLMIFLVSFVLACIQFYLHIHFDRPIIFSFLYFIVMVLFLVLTVPLIIDLLSRSERTIRGKIISIEGRIINMLTEDKKLKRIKINNSAVREMLKPDQYIQVSLTTLMSFPILIKQLDKDELIENEFMYNENHKSIYRKR